MAITVKQLRIDYPEFSDESLYIDSQIQFWLNFAYKFLDIRRWGTSLDLAAELYTAHNLVIEIRAQATAETGAPPGESQGMVSSKSVDKVSLSYDTSSIAQEGAGHWNLTIYGLRYIRLARMFGSGGIQLGVGSSPSGAWSGPDTTPGFTNFG